MRKTKRPIPHRWTEGKRPQHCSERFGHVGDDLRVGSGLTSLIHVFPANEKFPLSPVYIPQTFIQTFGVWIVGASHTEADLRAAVFFCQLLSFSN
jgi:hypothetical protein